jgi:hypothetical protein
MKTLIKVMNIAAVIWFLALAPLASYAIANVMQDAYDNRNN